MLQTNRVVEDGELIAPLDTTHAHKDNCRLVNNIIVWRQMLGDAYTSRDYLDFSVPRPESDLLEVCLTVNNVFSGFGCDMRVATTGGVVVPAIRRSS